MFAIFAASQVHMVMSDVHAGRWDAVTDERLEQADILYVVASWAQMTALAAAGVVFLKWFHRSRVNAEIFDPEGHRMKRGWAIGGWFVPVVNLWFPKKIANDIWDASTPPGPDGTVRPRVSVGLLNGWWALWIAGLVFGRAASQRYKKAEDAHEIIGAVNTWLIADGVGILAAAFAIGFVLKLTAMQTERAAHHFGHAHASASPVVGAGSN
ncbi:DUF4328 domain-containing protein [Streptomyces gobiensis]|uniref:DUF4328 domain-containing protein n=1 Tax=Streptomyces gobiensis TaxID=2875706 RepID=UPI001E508A6A|nr:DUF4328 domain-containing protein [Streptomyces gobiensis]UGY93536.1 DUF4328 domain-containing protein [Streptomyces gobiensis]